MVVFMGFSTRDKFPRKPRRLRGPHLGPGLESSAGGSTNLSLEFLTIGHHLMTWSFGRWFWLPFPWMVWDIYNFLACDFKYHAVSSPRKLGKISDFTQFLTLRTYVSLFCGWWKTHLGPVDGRIGIFLKNWFPGSLEVLGAFERWMSFHFFLKEMFVNTEGCPWKWS